MTTKVILWVARLIAFGLVVFGLYVFNANSPRAHADDSSYLAAVGGIYHVWSPGQMLTLGHTSCDQMRKGRTVDQQIASAPWQMGLDVDVPGMVYAAQRELCPTVGH